MHVNNQWDLEYKEVEEAFRRYRIDSKQGQSELTARLKESKDGMSAEIRELQGAISRRDKEVIDLKMKVRLLEDEVRGSRFGKPVVSRERVKELEEESHMLRQQVRGGRGSKGQGSMCSLWYLSLNNSTVSIYTTQGWYNSHKPLKTIG